MQVRIIDNVMGFGKTTGMFDYIRKHKDEKYLYITPYLSEVDRILTVFPAQFSAPVHRGEGKLHNLLSLADAGTNIVCTHMLFLYLDPITVTHFSGYTLIMDEVLDVISTYNSVCPNKAVTSDDIQFLLNKDVLNVDSCGETTWECFDDIDDFHYSEIRRLSETDSLVCIDKSILLWRLPPIILSSFKNIYVLTYMVKGSMLHHYLTSFNIPYNIVSVQNGELVDHIDDTDSQKQFKQLITIIDDDGLNRIGARRNSLSKSSYNNSDVRKQMKKNVNTVLKRHKIKSSQVMWTSFKRDRDKLTGKGYKYIRRLTKEEQKLPEDSKALRTLMCHVPCNCRATNDFRKRTFLMYLINRFFHPEIKKYFSYYGVPFNEDACALAELLQWIFRSAIRDGAPITIYIPSKRMRNLLERWLDGEVVF